MYVRTYVRTYVCMYVRMYVCMYVPSIYTSLRVSTTPVAKTQEGFLVAAATNGGFLWYARGKRYLPLVN